MPFSNLLLSACFLPSTTSHNENGNDVKLSQKAGETILFFSIDKQGNSDCEELRKLLGLGKPGEKICDLLVLYVKKDENQGTYERVICFIEMKGSRVDTAVQQVISTYNAFCELLKKDSKNLLSKFTAKAYIKVKASSATKNDNSEKELEKVFGRGNYRILRDSDLDDFVRGEAYQPKGKKGKSNKK